MIRMLTTFSMLLLMTGAGGVAAAADAAHGQELHAAHCTRCHVEMTGGDGSALYTRADRKVKTASALEAQVQRCQTNLNLLWFDEDVMGVAAYLNQQFYKFDAK